jgi:hypothetical protein
MEQRGESAGPLDEGTDRGAIEADDQITIRKTEAGPGRVAGRIGSCLSTSSMHTVIAEGRQLDVSGIIGPEH